MNNQLILVGRAVRDPETREFETGRKASKSSIQDDGKGWYSVKVTDGPLKGRTGTWEKGSTKFQFDGVDGGLSEFDLPK